MKCVLKDLTEEEHSKITDKRYGEIFMNCPLLDGKQICFWCCLHIRDIAEPLNRGDYSAAHPEYESLLPKLSMRDWDEICGVCSKCSR